VPRLRQVRHALALHAVLVGRGSRGEKEEAVSHATITAALKEGAEQADTDYLHGQTRNPFLKSAYYWQHTAWKSRMRKLECADQHDQSQCCSIHDRHLSHSTRSFRGLTMCEFCPDHIKREFNERASKP
jgi:hypothetical protein